MSGLRISAISFLNTAPLMWDFEHGPAGAALSRSSTPSPRNVQPRWPLAGPTSVLSRPSHMPQIPGLVILPNIAIASKDRVRSILLVSKKPHRRRAHRGDRHLVPHLGCPDAGTVRQVSRRTPRVHAASARPEGDAQGARCRVADRRLGAARSRCTTRNIISMTWAMTGGG